MAVDFMAGIVWNFTMNISLLAAVYGCIPAQHFATIFVWHLQDGSQMNSLSVATANYIAEQGPIPCCCWQGDILLYNMWSL